MDSNKSIYPGIFKLNITGIVYVKESLDLSVCKMRKRYYTLKTPLGLFLQPKVSRDRTKKTIFLAR